ncbi:MAG: phosphatidate cytidylyltransferase [Chlamydiales bacterium]|nr:phosphatidate cytidylyltransferase [Chlamydiales bacterium]
MSKKNLRKAKDLTQRTLINGLSALLIALFIFLAEVNPLRWLFTAAIAAIASIAIWEYNRLLKRKELTPAVALSVTAAVLYIFAVFFKTQAPYPHYPYLWHHLPEIILGIAFFACFAYFTAIPNSPLLNIATSFFGIVYIAIPLGLFVRVIYFFSFDGVEDPQFQGSWWIVYLIATTKSADVGGYFIGSYFGKRKLAHRLSPNKTLEGALGGLAASIAMSLLICFLGRKVGGVLGGFTYVQSLWLGCLMGVLGQMGDLAESLLKRDAGVKDSNSIPGVGGILDMIDSLLFTAPLVYIFLEIVYT